jgi:hypothetical protein
MPSASEDDFEDGRGAGRGVTLPLITFDDRSGGVKLDLNQLIVSRLLIQANSGGGKSHAVRYLLEQTFGKVQQIVIDPEGEFATLREKYPYLLVGIGGDVPADIRGAKLLPRKLLELGLSAIIDLSEFGLPQQRSYVQNFTDALNHVPRELWKDCLVVYDEGHRWAPEVGRSSGKEVQPLTEAIATLQSAGRKRGFCGIIATQRLSKLNKDVAAECLNKLIGRTSNEDIKRAGDELGLSKLQGKELRSLEPGTFWAYGPAISIDPVMVRTGSITTHPPKRGAARAPAPAAPGAIKKVLAELADLPQEAVEEARTVQDLQRKNADQAGRIRQLEKGVATKTVEKPVVDQAAIARAVKAAKDAGDRALKAARDANDRELRRFRQTIKTEVGRAVQQVNRLSIDGQQLATTIAAIESAANASFESPAPASRPIPISGDPLVSIVKPVPVPRAAKPDIAPEDGELPAGERKTLVAIAQYPDGAERDQLSVLTGFKKSTRNSYISRLALKGLVEARADRLFATDAGVDALGSDFEPLPQGEELQQYWLARLPEGERKSLTSWCRHIRRLSIAIR